MWKRKRPRDAPLPRSEDSPPAEPGHHGEDAVALWRVLAVIASFLIGFVFGILGVLIVSIVASFRFLRSFYHVLRGDLGTDGLFFVLEMETIPVTLLVLLPVWLGYAIAAMTGF